MSVERQLLETERFLEQLQRDYLESQTRLSLQYEQAVSGWIAQHMSYPAQASSRHIEGRVILAVTIDRLGEIIEVDMVESSDQMILDQAALETIAGITQFPPIPERLSAQTYTVNIPFNFRLD